MKLVKSAGVERFNTSLSLWKEISLVNLTDISKCFLINLFLLIDQKFVFSTVDVKLSLSLFSSYIRITNDLFLVPGATRTCRIFKYFKLVQLRPYIATIFTIIVKLWVVFIFILT